MRKNNSSSTRVFVEPTTRFSRFDDRRRLASFDFTSITLTIIFRVINQIQRRVVVLVGLFAPIPSSSFLETTLSSSHHGGFHCTQVRSDSCLWTRLRFHVLPRYASRRFLLFRDAFRSHDRAAKYGFPVYVIFSGLSAAPEGAQPTLLNVLIPFLQIPAPEQQPPPQM